MKYLVLSYNVEMISDAHETKFIKIENKKVPVWCYGDPKNKPIFFIHGFFNAYSEYIGDLPIRHLMLDYYIVAFDLPGFGHSRDIQLSNIEFISLIQKEILKNKRIVLFGVSYGGLLSIKYSLSYPEKVKALIVAGTPVFYGIFNLYKLVALFPKYKKVKITLRDFKEFDEVLKKENLIKIKIPVLLYYNSADFAANIFMGRWLNKNIPNSYLFISKNQNHGWLLHKINKNGLLEKIDILLKNL